MNLCAFVYDTIAHALCKVILHIYAKRICVYAACGVHNGRAQVIMGFNVRVRNSYEYEFLNNLQKKKQKNGLTKRNKREL